MRIDKLGGVLMHSFPSIPALFPKIPLGKMPFSSLVDIAVLSALPLVPAVDVGRYLLVVEVVPLNNRTSESMCCADHS